jgi:2-amino-4-hydroxy-6-hydroxymethyldihydropteridine diphosphokinase
VRRVSRFRRTAPEGWADQPAFRNAVVGLATDLAPARLLAAVQRIERRMGRVPTFRNGPRLIDIDLLDVRGTLRRTERLELPHPRIASRRFVLEPLAEIAPAWRHPVTGKSAEELLAALD